MFKKMTVLAMAVGVVAAFALPASASASWKHSGVAIQNNVQLNVTGKVRFQGTLGGVECQVKSQVTFLAGQTTGIAHQFVAHPTNETTNCVGLGGIAPCQIHNLTPQTAANWSFHTESWQTVTAAHPQTTLGATHTRAAVITPQTIQSQLTGGVFCLVKKVQLHVNKIGLTEEIHDPAAGQVPTTVTAGDGLAVTNLDVNGDALATIETNGGAVDQEQTLVSGTVQVEAPQNTYDL